MGARRGRAVVRAATAMAGGLPPAAGALNRRPPAPAGVAPQPSSSTNARTACAVAASAGKNDSIESSATRDVTCRPERRPRAQEASSPSPARSRSGTATSPAPGRRRCAARRRAAPRAPRRARRARGRRWRRPGGPGRRAGARATRARLAMRGAIPSGCRLSRRTLTGGSSRCGRHALGEQRDRRGCRRPCSHARSTTIAGYGSWPRRSWSRRRPTGSISGSVQAALRRRPARSRRRAAARCGRAAARRAARPGAGPSLARPRAPGLDEAQVARGDAGLQREVELAQAASPAPVRAGAPDAGGRGVDRGMAGRYRPARRPTPTSEVIDAPPTVRLSWRHDRHHHHRRHATSPSGTRPTRAPPRARGRVFTEDARYLDPLMTGEGPDGIAAMIAGGPGAVPRPPLRARLRARRPPRPRALLLAPVAGEGAVPAGLDFATVADDGRLRSVTGFLEPAAA